MKVTIKPVKLHGSITPPPSKSQSHRLVLAAALGKGSSVIRNVILSQDILATLSCVEQLGASWQLTEGHTLHITGIGQGTPHLREDGLPHFDCGESGSTLRFMIPVALALCGGGVFTGRGRLMERPQQPYFDLFAERKIEYILKEGKLTVRGQLTSGEYALAGNVSSQFFTGLLFALPLLDGPSLLKSTTQVESLDYIIMTLDALEQAGIRAGFRNLRDGIDIFPGEFHPLNAEVEADWSQAAFWYAAAGLGSDITVKGMNMDSHQGDMAILDWGDRIEGKPLDGGFAMPAPDEVGDRIPPLPQTAASRRDCSAAVDVSRCPDLVPPAAAWGTCMNGSLCLKNAGRLRIKESDRLSAVARTLGALGAQVQEKPEELVIRGQCELTGGVTVDCCNDHRIAMMAAIAATRCKNPVTLTGAECVQKSYPGFWEDYEALGGIIEIGDKDP